MSFGSYSAKKLYAYLILLCISFFASSDVLRAAYPGDLNNDGIVYLDDLTIIAQHWLNGPCSDEDGWCSGADINRSSSVDFADFSKFAKDWLHTTNSPELELYPTINCIGIRLSHSGNPQHTVEYRLAGTSSWQQGHFLTAIGGNRLVGSLFWLRPNSLYQVKITIGSEVFTGAVTTRADNPPESMGETYYVATDGNDANPGTSTDPFATIGKAASMVQSGDTVIVRSGTYNELINFTTSGTLTNPIHFKSEMPLAAVIDGNGFGSSVIVKFTNASNIVFEGFTIQNTKNAMIINNSSNIWITGNDISCTDGEVIEIFKNTSTNNVIQYNHLWDTIPGGSSSGGNTGVNMEAGRGSIVRYNEVHGLSNGIGAGHLFDAGLIDDESINPDIDVYGNVLYDIGDDALEPEGACINNRLWDNHISDSFVAISLAPIGVGPAFIIRNTCFESTPIKFHLTGGCGPAYVYHYTSFKGTRTGYGLKTHNLGNYNHDVVFRNNIIHASDSFALYGAGGDLDYNLYFYTGSSYLVQWDTEYYSTLEEFQAAVGQELHGCVGDPLFVDAWGQDFNIQSASPARNVGVYIPGINDDYKGTAPDIGAFEFVENERPEVYAGPDQSIVDPNNSVTLSGTVTDDGLPNPPGVVSVQWTQQSGPGTVTFADANSLNTTAVFSAGDVGQYVLRLTANDSNLSDYDEVTVTYYPSNTLNQAPVVDAGTDQIITPPASANLNGTVTDDGLPNPPGAVTTTWTKASGPGAVTFGDIHAVDTTASFIMSGTYVLRLTANDGALQAYDEVTITVNQPVNHGPSVNAGIDQTIIFPDSTTLNGTVTDDGFPNPPGVVTTLWTKQSGPGTVTFGNAGETYTTATFSMYGVYVLRLTANDSDLESYDQVTITVNPPPPSYEFLADTPAGWSFDDPNSLLQTIYGTAQDSSGNITANAYRAIQKNKGLAMAFQIPQNTTLDKGIFKSFGSDSGVWRTGEKLRIRLFNVTGKGYLTYNHSGVTKSDPGGGSSAVVNFIATTPSPVPYHSETDVPARQYTDMVIDFGPLPVTAGEYFITFDVDDSSNSNTWGCFVRSGSVAVSDDMGEYPDGSPLPKRATVTKNGVAGNTYYYQLDATSSTSYTAYSYLFSFQMLTKDD